MPRIFDAKLFEDTAQNLLFLELNHKQPDIKILSTSIHHVVFVFLGGQ
jgi:hypothetical protein